MQLRVARHTQRLQEVVGFYRDGIGLTEIGGFRNHGGYDGVFLAVPGTDAHLELTTSGGHGARAPHPESLLGLYLGADAAVQTVAARLGVDPVPPANSYWAEHRLTFEDPDGFRVVLGPTQPDGGDPAQQVVGQGGDQQPGGVGGELARGVMAQADAGLEVADAQLDDGVAAVILVEFDGGADPVGDQGVVAPVGNSWAWAPIRRVRRTISRSPR